MTLRSLATLVMFSAERSSFTSPWSFVGIYGPYNQQEFATMTEKSDALPHQNQSFGRIVSLAPQSACAF